MNISVNYLHELPNSIYIFGRTNHKRKVVLTTTADNYVYANSSFDKDYYRVPFRLSGAMIKPVSKKDLFGKDVIQILFHNKYDKRKFVNRIDDIGNMDLYESDLNAVDHFFLDNEVYEGISCKVPRNSQNFIKKVKPISIKSNLRKLYYDIEVDDTQTNWFPDWRNPVNDVIAISCYDSYSKCYYTFALYDKELVEKITLNSPVKTKKIKWILKTYDNETKLLKEFINFFRFISPDLFCGWNSKKFDDPYMLSRMKYKKIDINKLSLVNIADIREWKGEVKCEIVGTNILDLKIGYKGITLKTMKYTSLQRTAQKVLKIGKVAIDSSPGTMRKKNFKKFCLYSLVDVVLLVELDQKVEIIDTFDKERFFNGCKYLDTFKASKMVDTTFLRRAREENIVLPSRSFSKGGERYIGAITYKPVPGKHDNLVVADMAAFYPSIMILLNIGFETYERDLKVIKKLDEFIQFAHLTTCFTGRFPTSKWYRASNGAYFRKDKDSFVRKTVSRGLARRKEFKKMRDQYAIGTELYNKYQEKQKNYKRNVNATYGVSGYESFRLYHRPSAEGTTTSCREVIEFIRIRIESKSFRKLMLRKHGVDLPGLKVVYGDTDSVFVKFPDSMNKKDLRKYGELAIEEINKMLKIVATRFFYDEKHFTLNLALENLTQRMVITEAKKKYARWDIYTDGIWKDTIKIAGLEAIKASTPEVAREIQERFVKLALFNIDPELIRKGLKKIQARMMFKKYTLESFAMSSGIKTTITRNRKSIPMHVRAALNANENFNAGIEEGDRIFYVFLKVGQSAKVNERKYIVKKGETDVLAFKSEELFPKELKKIIDIKRHVKKCIDSQLERIAPFAINMRWDKFWYRKKDLDEYF